MRDHITVMYDEMCSSKGEIRNDISHSLLCFAALCEVGKVSVLCSDLLAATIIARHMHLEIAFPRSVSSNAVLQPQW